MKILVVSDIHSNADALRDIAARVPKPDIILIAGDITHFGRREEAEKILAPLHAADIPYYAIPGNCDYKEVLAYLEEKGTSLHRKLVYHKDIQFVGLGGSLPAPAQTPFVWQEEEARQWLQELSQEITQEKPVVAVFHQPPRQTKLDRVMRMRHVGSKAVREFIERHTPILFVSGHIHESKGHDILGGTTLINPGPAKQKKYALVSINDEHKLTHAFYSI